MEPKSREKVKKTMNSKRPMTPQVFSLLRRNRLLGKTDRDRGVKGVGCELFRWGYENCILDYAGQIYRRVRVEVVARTETSGSQANELRCVKTRKCIFGRSWPLLRISAPQLSKEN